VKRNRIMSLPRVRSLVVPMLHLLALTFVLLAWLGESAWTDSRGLIRIVVPFPPGGGIDILGRLLADEIGRTQHLTMMIENRPGAGTVVGTEFVSRAVPDGSTLLLITPNLILNPHLRNLSYDPLTSFAPVCRLADSPVFVVVNSSSPYRSLADLLQAAQARPGELTWAGPGLATVLHIAFERLSRETKAAMTYVPYAGTTPVIGALLGSHVSAAFAEYAGAAEQIKAGKLRALAVAAKSRSELLPDVPTIAESGYPNFRVELWYGLFAPARTPMQKVAELAEWFKGALQVPEVKTKLAIDGIQPDELCGAEFNAFVQKQHEEYGQVIRAAHIKIE